MEALPAVSPSELVLANVSITHATRVRSPIYDLDELFSLPDPEWIVPCWFRSGDTGSIFGESSSGKTFLVTDLIVRLAAGLAPCGFDRFKPDKPIHVLLLTDEAVYDARTRLRAALKAHGITDQDEAFHRIHMRQDVTQLYDQSSAYNVEELLSYLDERKDVWGEYPGLIIADHLMNSARGGKIDQSNDDAAAVMSSTRQIANCIGGAFYFVHHTAKVDKGLPRGAQALFDLADHLVQVEGTDGPRTVSCTKLKAAEKWSSRMFTIAVDEDTPEDRFGNRPAHIEWTDTSVTRRKSDREIQTVEVKNALRALDARSPASAKGSGSIRKVLDGRYSGQQMGKLLNILVEDPYSGVKTTLRTTPKGDTSPVYYLNVE